MTVKREYTFYIHRSFTILLSGEHTYSPIHLHTIVCVRSKHEESEKKIFRLVEFLLLSSLVVFFQSRLANFFFVRILSCIKGEREEIIKGKKERTD